MNAAQHRELLQDRHLKVNRRNLDPIEGIWDAYGQIPHRIGIMTYSKNP